MKLKKLKVVTHAGGFHTDELFAIALIKHFVDDNIDIVRTRDRQLLKQFKRNHRIWVIDVGGEYNPQAHNFDHHQSTFRKTWIGTDILLSSCGLVWTYLKKNGYLKNLTNFQISEFENKLVKRIDAHDNGSGKWAHAVIFKLFNRSQNNDNGFLKALAMAGEYISNSLFYFKNEGDNIKNLYVHKYVSNGRIVVVDDAKFFNVIPSIKMNTNADVVVEHKVSEDAWSVQGIKYGILVPEIWRGVSEKELAEITDADVVFAHRSGHLVKTKTKETAMRVAKLMISESEWESLCN
ncbi:MYG1 family protein [Photobacterium damselae]|uniref:MYG1 family protein n=1 Tax=Photobacterium damselae TaxID=38293 RepID=UPI001F2F7DF5|nr:MYG1 family protein [Photobacterium damselae]UKA04636.1 MYG1 family protein [Photobacterium damselae subsp. damselae]